MKFTQSGELGDGGANGKDTLVVFVAGFALISASPEQASLRSRLIASRLSRIVIHREARPVIWLGGIAGGS